VRDVKIVSWKAATLICRRACGLGIGRRRARRAVLNRSKVFATDSTVEQLSEKQRIAAAEGDDADVYGFHFENEMLAVNLFHTRWRQGARPREFFWTSCRRSYQARPSMQELSFPAC